MKTKIEVEKLTLDIAGQKVEVTPAQARELHEKLGDLLGLPKERIVTVERYSPPTQITYPVITWDTGTPPPFGDQTRITCGLLNS